MERDAAPGQEVTRACPALFVPTGEVRQTEVHTSWQGSCVRGDLFFEAPGGAWDGGAYTLVIDGDTGIRLPIEID